MSQHLTFSRLIEAPTEISIESMPPDSRGTSSFSSGSLHGTASGISSTDGIDASHEGVAEVMPDSEGSPTVEWVPFLTWRLNWGPDPRTPESMDQSLIQLLNKVNANLLAGKLGKQHRTSFQCTEADLVSRVRAISLTPLAVSNSLPAASMKQHNGFGIARDLKDNLSDVIDEPPDFDGPRETGLRVFEMLGLYRNIMDHFLPRNGSASIHPICTRFWGALDTIIRVIPPPIKTAISSTKHSIATPLGRNSVRSIPRHDVGDTE
jgi:hypothetical protein